MLSFYVDDCKSPLGIQNGKIPDSNIYTTMGTFEDNFLKFGAPRARLMSSSGYRADPASINMIDLYARGFVIVLTKETIVTGIATQGLGEEWIESYHMAFISGNDGTIVEPSSQVGLSIKGIVHVVKI